MMKLYRKLIVILMVSTAFADEAKTSLNNTPAMTHAPVAPQYDNRFGFSSNRLVYERTKNDSIYFGVDLWAELYSTVAIKHNYNRSFYRYKKHINDGGMLGRGEVRFGYNFLFNSRDHFTPDVNAGYLRTIDGSGKKFVELAYGGLGFIYSHEFNSVFGWGLKFNGLLGQLKNHYTFTEEYVSDYKSVVWYYSYTYTPRIGFTYDPVYRDVMIWDRRYGKKTDKLFGWGIDICLPIIFRWGHYRHWDITLEPSVCYIGSKDIALITFGGRGTLGYRF